MDKSIQILGNHSLVEQNCVIAQNKCKKCHVFVGYPQKSTHLEAEADFSDDEKELYSDDVAGVLVIYSYSFHDDHDKQSETILDCPVRRKTRQWKKDNISTEKIKKKHKQKEKNLKKYKAKLRKTLKKKTILIMKKWENKKSLE